MRASAMNRLRRVLASPLRVRMTLIVTMSPSRVRRARYTSGSVDRLASDARLQSLLNVRYMLWPLRLRETDTVLGRMTALIVALLASLRVTIFSRLELAAEILALRHQLAVLQRNT